jgi:hypothetical protein
MKADGNLGRVPAQRRNVQTGDSLVGIAAVPVMGAQRQDVGGVYYGSASCQAPEAGHIVVGVSTVAARSVIVWVNGTRLGEYEPNETQMLGAQWRQFAAEVRPGRNVIVLRLDPVSPICSFAARIGVGTVRTLVTDDGYVQRWAISGPWQRPAAAVVQPATDAPLLPPETSPGTIDPIADFVDLAQKRRLVWRMEQFDFSSPATPIGENAILYAAVEFEAQDSQDALLNLDTNGEYILWVNSERISPETGIRPQRAEGICIPISVSRGRNTLLLRLHGSARNSTFRLRLLDATGKPLIVNYWPAHD